MNFYWTVFLVSAPFVAVMYFIDGRLKDKWYYRTWWGNTAIVPTILAMMIACATAALGIVSLFGVIEKGNRTGVITSVSHEGLIWKTWEITLVTSNKDGTFAADGDEKYYGVVDASVLELVKDRHKNMDVVQIDFERVVSLPWETLSRKKVVGIKTVE